MTLSAALPEIGLDVDALRTQFPILSRMSRGKPLVYLDNAATSQKPLAVLDAIDEWYRNDNANIHRGVYQLSETATLAWEAARATVARFLNAPSAEEVVLVSGTTEAINLVAHSFVKPRLGPDGWVLVTEMEHHANIVPWQLVGARTVPIPVTDTGELDMVAAERLLADRPTLFAVSHASNALGTINPVEQLCAMATAHGVPVLVDGAQAVPHLAVDVSSIGCDFYCFSAHKVFGPTGIGALWAKRVHLEMMPPYQGGGDMIEKVSFEKTTYADAPGRFEAGTPHIAGGLGLAVALDWLDAQDRNALSAHEDSLLQLATAELGSLSGVHLWGRAAAKVPVVTFTIDGGHPHDIASLLDGDGIAVRAGHHCAQPLHRRLGLNATVRASFAPYNTVAEVHALVESVARAAKVLR